MSARSRSRLKPELRPVHAQALGRGLEWQFETVTFPRELSRNVVTKLLVERAEHGRWELDRTRITPDGTRQVVLRRKIIRQVFTA